MPFENLYFIQTSQAMNNLRWMFAAAIIVALTSCKKNVISFEIEHDFGEESPTESTVSAYFPTTIGSYWIYETVTVDTLGNESPGMAGDTITIIGDTVINGNTFAIAEGTWLSSTKRQWYYRDSADYIVTSYGGLLVTDQATTETLGINFIANVGTMYKMIDPNPGTISTPVGTFDNIIDARTDLWSLDPNYQWGTPRSDHSYFVHGIGNVLQIIYFYSSPNYLHRRLTDYYISS